MFVIYKMLCGRNTLNIFFNLYYNFIVADMPQREEFTFLLCAKTWTLRGEVAELPLRHPRFDSMVYYKELSFTHSGCCCALERHVKAYRSQGLVVKNT